MIRDNFKSIIKKEKFLQIVGVPNALCALQAEQAGFKALYISGAGVANAVHGLPDLGLTSLSEVAAEVRKLSLVTKLPILVDADTGWGGVLSTQRTAQVLSHAGASGMHLEDQVFEKRCGHRDGKALISTSDMCEKIQYACKGRLNQDFLIMARTDAYGVEGLLAAIERANMYVEAGAEAIFAEAMFTLKEYKQFAASVSVPVLANITEFGKTPLFKPAELEDAGVKMMLHPLSCFRAMMKASELCLKHLHAHGSVENILDSMQTRTELYELLNYENQEKKVR